MTHAQYDDEYDWRAARRKRRRGKAAVGAAGLAALLGGGAFLVTDLLTGKPETIATDSGALSPLAPPSLASEPPSASASTSATRHGRSGAAASKSAEPAPSAGPTTKSAEQRIKDARRDAAEHGVPLMRPLPAVTVPQADIRVTNSGSLQSRNGTLRVVWAPGDLTGQRELAWAADDGDPYADARCTQTLRLSNDTKGSTKPTVMMCWRTSATRSVIAIQVRLDGHPSRAVAAAAVDKQWRAMG